MRKKPHNEEVWGEPRPWVVQRCTHTTTRVNKNINTQPSARLGEANEKNLNFNPVRDLQPQSDANMKGGLIMKASIIVDVHACINLYLNLPDLKVKVLKGYIFWIQTNHRINPA